MSRMKFPAAAALAALMAIGTTKRGSRAGTRSGTADGGNAGHGPGHRAGYTNRR
ncbi:hypothetical protein ACVJMZ_005513 [Sinorhizobium medicae]